MAMLISVVSFADDVTETIAMKGFGPFPTNSSYLNTTQAGVSDKGTAMVAYAYNPSNGQIRGSKTSVPGADIPTANSNHNWALYNTDAMAGAIKSITVTHTANVTSNYFRNNLYVALGTASQGLVKDPALAKQQTSMTPSSFTFEIDPTQGYTFFKIFSNEKFTSGTVTGVVVTVTYEGSTGGEGGDEEGDEEGVKYTITTAVNDEKMGSVSGAGTYAENAQVTLTATAKPGYKFVQWNDGSTENPLKFTVTQDTTYTATFQALDIVTVADAMALGINKEFVLNQFTVVQVQGNNIYIKDETGYGLIYKKDFGLKAGDVVESMPGKKGSYSGFGQLAPLVTKADLTITKGEIPEPEEFTTAPIAKDIYKYVKIDSVTVFEGAFKLLDGTKINYYNATLTEGHIYNIVGSVGHDNGTLQIDIASSTDITPKYTVTATAENGTVTGAGEYVQGTSATLTAAPAEGYEFTCWTSGNDTVSSDNPLILTVSADTALVANFAKKTFTIDVNVTPAESGTVTGLAERGVYEYGATATLTATPADNYEFVFWAVGEDTLSTETTYSFEVKDNAKLLAVFKYTKCTPLNAPVVTYTTTYNSATLTWKAVDNAVAYLVTVGNFFNEVRDTTYTAIRLGAATEYTYSVQAMSRDPKAYCDSEVTYGALTTAEAPVATLTLSENGETRNLEGDFRLNEIVTLPTTADECSKTFVGWDSNAECTVAPEYAPGAEYQLNELTQTLYAVYADVKPSETVTITPSEGTANGTTAYTYTLDATDYTLTAKKNSGTTTPTYNKNNKEVRVYAAGSLTLTAPKAMSTVVFKLSSQGKSRLPLITASVGTIATQAKGDAVVTWTGDASEVTFTVGAKAEFGSNSADAGQFCFPTFDVTYAGGEYSDFSTTCSVALDVPTFSVEAGEYTEAQSIVIAATEGTIYYTLDGTTPTAESTVYTEAIVLDKCGATTIKAIAISGEAQSEVVSATYTIKLPLDNSQENPYTEQEAIDVYNGDCYNNQDVYVIGVVKTAKLYTSGSYTITLEGGFQFYMFYEAAGETKFTEDYITAGDTLVACGKLGKHNTTYQLAAGCYLVDRKAYSVPKVDISNTEATAYTVEEAWTLIDDINSDLSKEVYVKGIVSEIVEAFSEQYGNITYNISTDGTTESNQLKVYRGKSFNGDKFTSADDIKVGDKVVVYGKLTKYNNTSYQVDSGSALVDRQREGGDGTALDNIETNVAPVKVIENGQMIIIKNGVKYNAQGAKL